MVSTLEEVFALMQAKPKLSGKQALGEITRTQYYRDRYKRQNQQSKRRGIRNKN
jgi:hypothetical protein